jgi:hypothetical protein
LPGGTSTQNIAAFRSDDLTWSFKYLSVREIDPSAQPEEPKELELVDSNNPDSLCSTDYCVQVASQHVENDGSIAAVSSADLSLRKSTTRASGTVTVAIINSDDVLAKGAISTSEIKTSFATVAAQFSSPIDV